MIRKLNKIKNVLNRNYVYLSSCFELDSRFSFSEYRNLLMFNIQIRQSFSHSKIVSSLDDLFDQNAFSVEYLPSVIFCYTFPLPSAL